MARNYIKVTSKEGDQFWSDQSRKMVNQITGWSSSNEFTVTLTVDTDYDFSIDNQPIPYKDGSDDTPGLTIRFKRKNKSEL